MRINGRDLLLAGLCLLCLPWLANAAPSPAATPDRAVYCALADVVVLLGVTLQLTGEHWLHARPFQYCGSVGPVELPAGPQNALTRLGDVLRAEFPELASRVSVALPDEANRRIGQSIAAASLPAIHAGKR